MKDLLRVHRVGSTTYINSNGRCLGFDEKMLEELTEFIARVRTGESRVQNYEDYVPVRVTSAPGLKSTADLLADLGLNTESKS